MLWISSIPKFQRRLLTQGTIRKLEQRADTKVPRFQHYVWNHLRFPCLIQIFKFQNLWNCAPMLLPALILRTYLSPATSLCDCVMRCVAKAKAAKNSHTFLTQPNGAKFLQCHLQFTPTAAAAEVFTAVEAVYRRKLSIFFSFFLFFSRRFSLARLLLNRS